MDGPVEWGVDGTPRSPRFDDIYRPAGHGLDQARHVFLAGCGLPQAWAGRPQWIVLETGFGLGLNFLATWLAWRNDPARPHLLHFVSIEAWPVGAADLVRSAAPHPELAPLSNELAQQWYGLLPGVHRLAFDEGRVLLTLSIGDVQDVLKRLSMRADSVFLDGFEPLRNPAMWDLPLVKAVARLCRRGAAGATWTVAGELRRNLAQCGFRVEKAPGLPPKRDCLRAVYDPGWEPKGAAAPAATPAGRCAVIGAGLAGAAVASSLSRRGWEVELFDASAQPASGASALPAGLMAPHQSPDDNLLSRLTRAGVRMTLQQAAELLRQGLEWKPSGVLEQRHDDGRPLPDLGAALQAWTRPATVREKAQVGCDDNANAWWHATAAWIKPAALVRAWIAQPGIRWHGSARVHRIARTGSEWHLSGEAGGQLAAVDLVVVAAALASADLLGGRIHLNPVRGQVSWSHELPAASPAFPVNGNGHFLPCVSLDGSPAWLSGSTYGRGDAQLQERAGDHLANLERLRGLVPAVARELETAFAQGRVHGWTGVRCASTDRRPLVGPVEPGLWVCTAMGSRGLTFAALCAELLAARLHCEPLPLQQRLADALAVERQLRL